MAAYVNSCNKNDVTSTSAVPWVS